MLKFVKRKIVWVFCYIHKLCLQHVVQWNLYLATLWISVVSKNIVAQVIFSILSFSSFNFSILFFSLFFFFLPKQKKEKKERSWRRERKHPPFSSSSKRVSCVTRGGPHSILHRVPNFSLRNSYPHTYLSSNSLYIFKKGAVERLKVLSLGVF